MATETQSVYNMAAAMSDYLHGLHDTGGEYHMGSAPGWLVVAINVHDTPHMDFTAFQTLGYGVIVRLNNGWYPNGALPSSDQYPDFARRCAEFVRASPGVAWVIIGNEPNHVQERPHGQEITPVQYAKCFDLCYSAVKNVKASMQVMSAAVAPWDNSSGDWTEYYAEMLTAIRKTDGFALHAYTHGSDPALVTSDAKQHGWTWNFRVYQDQLYLIPSKFALELPAFITECDQGDMPWADVNSGYIVSALTEISSWNREATAARLRKIHCLAFYRWQKHQDDIWWIEGKQGVIHDFEAGVHLGYRVPKGAPTPAPEPPDPDPTPAPEPEPIPDKEYLEYWDARLPLRKTRLGVVEAPAGDEAWHVTYGKWYDPQEAGGRVNVFVSVYDEKGALVSGVPVKFFWGGGGLGEQDVKNTEVKYDPFLGGHYSLDFGPMKVPAPAYGVQVLDGNPSDVVDGLGLGSLEAPDYNEHTCYWFKFKRMRSKGPLPEPPVKGRLRHPLGGNGRITQHFYQDPAGYEQFGMIGHDGTDFGGVPEGTPVRAIADGTVAFVGTDPDYGHYVRVGHPAFQVYSFYAHAAGISVQVGQVVKAGQEVCRVGHTGNVSPPGALGAHLHLEIRRMQPDGSYNTCAPMPNGRIDPETFFALNEVRL